MSELKTLAAAAFYAKYNELHKKSEVGSIVYDKKGNMSVRLTPTACRQCLWNDGFVKTANGKQSMRAALEALYVKWGNLRDFVVKPSATHPEMYYKVTALLYSLLVLKVSGCRPALCIAARLACPCPRAG